MTEERAVLAGGCFWGMQDLFRRYDGVISTRVGYSGGDVPNATYRNHGTHAEAIEIIFDPTKISYRRLLEFFFQIHDPTTRNRQGNDVGMSYRSAIFYTSDEQRRVAEDTIADVEASGLWPGKVVTEVSPAGPFWEAEPEHQDYLERIPNGYTCHFIRPGWKLPARKDTGRVRVERRRVARRLIQKENALTRCHPSISVHCASAGGAAVTAFSGASIHRQPRSGIICGYVCFGSLADIGPRPRHVRSSPQSGHSSARFACPLSAKSGHCTARRAVFGHRADGSMSPTLTRGCEFNRRLRHDETNPDNYRRERQADDG